MSELPLHPELRNAWELAGYPKNQASTKVSQAPAKGWRRLYYLTGQEFALSNIVFGRLKVSRFDQLNDPFELIGTYLGTSEQREVVLNNKKNFNLDNGVICLSEDWSDPVLWSHYASKHKGIALGFDVREASIKKVTYTDLRLKNVLKGVTTTLNANDLEVLFTTKFTSWKYEREWRLLIDLKQAEKEGGMYFQKIGSDLSLREVILGPLCDYNIRKIRSIVAGQYPNAITYKAQLAKRSFRVIAMGRTVP